MKTLRLMGENNEILEKAGTYVFNYLKEHLSNEYVYHNYKHTLETVESCEEIAAYYDLGGNVLEHILLAAWFHDTGYTETYKGHEAASADIAREYLQKERYTSEGIEAVQALILSTTRSNPPHGLLEEILHDSDIINVGKGSFFNRAELLRVEWELFLDRFYTNFEWEKLQLEFLLNTEFYTEYAIREYGDEREKNIRKQRENLTKSKQQKAKDKRKKSKIKLPGRGIETMYRAAYRNHINLSSIADSKANMMISINTIIMSVIITVVGSGFTITGKSFYEHFRFTAPIGILLFGALISVIFAILSARPNVTSKTVDMEKIKKKKSSILFFGNFANMKLDDFIDSMNELMQSKEMLYDNMTIDLYYLGSVLKRKYILLRMSYGIFMGALILSVLTFVIIFFYSYENV